MLRTKLSVHDAEGIGVRGQGMERKYRMLLVLLEKHNEIVWVRTKGNVQLV